MLELTNLISDNATFAIRGDKNAETSDIESDSADELEHTFEDVEDVLEGKSESGLNYENSDSESDQLELLEGDNKIYGLEVEGDLDEEQSEGSEMHGVTCMSSSWFEVGSVNENSVSFKLAVHEKDYLQFP